MAYVETPLSSGSAVRFAPDRVLTNAHVVWPYDAARIVFPDGAEVARAPVIARDRLADLAVLDVSTPERAEAAAPLPDFGDGTDLPIGTELYLVGYPGESEEFPQPALSRGILSRVRRWNALDLPYLQTDAAIAGGQSGGILAAPDGTVVGFSSMTFGEAAFGLAAGAPEVLARVERLLAGEDLDRLGPRPLPSVDDPAGGRRARVELANAWDEAVFVLGAPYGTSAELTAEGDGDATLTVLDPYGEIVADADAPGDRPETVSVELLEAGPYFVVVTLDQRGEVRLRSSTALAPLDDPDDGRSLRPGETAAAAMDFPGDYDFFLVDLTAGQSITLTVDTVNLAPDIWVEPDDPQAPLPAGAPEIGGPLGLTATLALTAAWSGRHVVMVSDLDGVGTGGYLVRLE